MLLTSVERIPKLQMFERPKPIINAGSVISAADIDRIEFKLSHAFIRHDTARSFVVWIYFYHTVLHGKTFPFQK